MLNVFNSYFKNLKDAGKNYLNITNNCARSLNIVAEWNKYYFDFKRCYMFYQILYVLISK